MLKTAAFTVQIGQNVENSKADFKNKYSKAEHPCKK